MIFPGTKNRPQNLFTSNLLIIKIWQKVKQKQCRFSKNDLIQSAFESHSVWGVPSDCQATACNISSQCSGKVTPTEHYRKNFSSQPCWICLSDCEVFAYSVCVYKYLRRSGPLLSRFFHSFFIQWCVYDGCGCCWSSSPIFQSDRQTVFNDGLN